MARVKNRVRQRRKRWLKLAKGYRGKRGKLYRIARVQVMKSLVYAYRDRRRKKREMRQLSILQVNAKCREFGLSYSKFIWGLKKLEVKINRKELALLARENPDAFSELTERVKNCSKNPVDLTS